MPDSNLPSFRLVSAAGISAESFSPFSPSPPARTPPDTPAAARVESPRMKRDAGATGEQEDHG